MATTPTYMVRVQYDVRDAGQSFGPFQDRDSAEECVIALASRENVKSAIIEESN